SSDQLIFFQRQLPPSPLRFDEPSDSGLASGLRCVIQYPRWFQAMATEPQGASGTSAHARPLLLHNQTPPKRPTTARAHSPWILYQPNRPICVPTHADSCFQVRSTRAISIA
ncbi:unnamed protein product, partial [Sphacelaria rigidula]